MPLRISGTSVQIKQTIYDKAGKPTDTKYSFPAETSRQEISALNNVGIWCPGKYRANAVTITRLTQGWTPGSTERQSFGVLRNATLTGDIAAYLALGAGNIAGNVTTIASQFPSTAGGYSQNKALSRMNEPDFDVGVILGELTETIGGLINPLSAMRKYIKTWNKLQKSGAKRALTDTFEMLTGSWLEWRYGITPLISTIQDGYEHFTSTSETLKERLERSKGGTNLPLQTTTARLSVGPGQYSITGNVTYRAHRKAVSSAIWQLTEPLTWQERYGLDGGHLLSVAWELVPLSFVCDWFLGIGDWLGSIDFSGKRTMLGMITSYKSVVDVRVDDVKAGLYGCPQVPTGSTFDAKFERLKRTIGQSRPMSPLVNPGVLSLERQVDAASLLWQRLPKFWR